jgi:NAD(P)-dependent dehydrogenase (short-subunit alcohol dehydrogenase family)
MTSSRTIAIFGFGPGLGMGTARRFGREGFRVAAVSRDPARAEPLLDSLRDKGIEALGVPADITDETALRRAIGAVATEFGSIDVAVHSAAMSMAVRATSTLDTDVAALREPLAVKLYSAIHLTRALAPAMIERGEGALLFSSGASQRLVQPYLANAGVALGAQREYVRQLHAELAEHNVYVGLLAIGGLIGDSAAERLLAEHPELAPADLEIVRIPNDQLGERYWQMYRHRDRPEVEVGFPGG